MPKSINLDMVWTMFSELRKDINRNREADRTEIRLFKEACVSEAGQVVNQVFEQQENKVRKLKLELSHYKNKTEILAGICNSLHTEVTDLTQRLDNVELSCSKKMVIITGYDLPEQSKDNNIEVLQALFASKIGVHAKVEDFYLLGTKFPKQIVCEFQSLRDKRLVLKNKYLLKNFRKDGRKVFINEYTPISIQEKRRREQKIIADIEAQVEPDENEEIDLGIQYTKAGLTIQGSPYRKKVLPPTPLQLLDLNPQQLDSILKLTVNKGDEIRQEKSRFVAFSAEVKTHQDIRNIYMKLKLIQPDARHIACAYYIQGPTHTSRDFHDDGEPGSGRILLKILEDSQLENKAVFVVRMYGGIKLGAERFSCYAKAAKNALNIADTPQQSELTTSKTSYPSEETGHLLQGDENDDNRNPGGRGRRSNRGRYAYYKRVQHRDNSRDDRSFNQPIRATRNPLQRGRSRGRGQGYSRGREMNNPYTFSNPISRVPSSQNWGEQYPNQTMNYRI